MDGQVPGVPEVQQPSPVEPMTQKTKTFFSQRLVILAGAVLLLLLIPGIFYISNKGAKKEVPVPPPAGGPTPTPTVQRVKTLPKDVSFNPQTTMEVFGRTVVSSNGAIQRVIKEGESYSVFLDSKQTITVQIGPKTLLGKAWYDIQNGVVVRSSYDIISPDNFVSLAKAQTKVKISYGTEDVKGGQVVVDEFVIAE